MSPRPHPVHAVDKLVLMLSLVPFLSERGSVSVTETARHFGWTENQIRDAVTLITVSGVPGSSASYLPGDLFDIDWDDLERRDVITLTHRVAIDDHPRFSARQAAALIAGLQYLSALPENLDRDALTSLILKLSRGSSGGPTPLAIAPAEADDRLRVIRDAIHDEHPVEFDYRNARGLSERRQVDPLRIESNDNDRYLRGWDHAREAVRIFRLDRMSALAATEEPIRYRPGDIVLSERLFEPSDDDLTVTIDVATRALPLLADYLPERASAIETGELSRVTLRVADYHGLKRLVTGLPGVITVVGPDDARAVVADWARAGAARYAPTRADAPEPDASAAASDGDAPATDDIDDIDDIGASS